MDRRGWGRNIHSHAQKPMLMRAFRDFLRDRGGNVTLVSALLLPSLLAFAGLATEFGTALHYKTQDQRVADAAAFAAATVYNSNNAASVTSIAQQIASMNGMPTSSVAASLVTSPSGDGNQAVRVVVSSQAPLALSKLIAPTPTVLNVSATSYAEIKSAAPGCVVALKPTGAGVTLSGGTALTAQSCAVDSDAAVTVPCGTTITTVTLGYNSTAAPSQPCNGIQAPAGKTLKMTKVSTPDPIAGTSQLTAATSDIANTQAVGNPSAPASVAGSNVHLDYSGTASGLPAGCTGAWTNSGNIWTITCTGNGPFNFGAFDWQGGITVRFNLSGSAAAVYNFASLTTQGTSSFGPGTYNIRGGLSTTGTVTFGAGTFNIGGLSSNCNSATNYAICNTGGGTLTFGGPSTFVLAGGIANTGGGTMTLGSGSTNSFQIGKASNGDSYTGLGGAIVTFADATSGSFKMAGNFNVSGGGSCSYIAAATNHEINGNFNAAGGVTAGAGLYTVNGYIAFGASGGGDVSCGGQTIGVLAQNVTFVSTAVTTPSSGTCSGQAFCVGAGYGHVVIAAPTTGSYANMAVVGPVSGSSTAGAVITEGASSTTISGAFYFPAGAISLSGAGNLGSGTGQCLEVVGSQVTLSGGSALATACAGLGATGGGAIVLVG